jgi:SAM-dependent methyltransferase
VQWHARFVRQVAMSDKEVLARQYADDRNLRARQRLWEISRSEPDLDFNRWSVDVMTVGVGDRVLDAGCGNGRPLALLRERGCAVIGLDQSFGMLKEIDHRLLTVADVQSLPFHDAAFDAAAAFMMLYHVPDQRAAATELRRVVRPGGLFVATTASTESQSELRAVVEHAVGGGWTWLRPSAASFHLEGAAEVLSTSFDSVEVIEAPTREIFITDSDAMADYIASSSDHFAPTLPPGTRWEGVVEAVRSATAQAIAADGALSVTTKLGAVVCR